MHNILYTNKALEDLENLFLFIYSESESNGIAYIERYQEKIKLLQSNPKIGTYCRNKNIDKNCRVLIFETHIIIYEIFEDRKEILIVRIFHSSENYQNKIK